MQIIALFAANCPPVNLLRWIAQSQQTWATHEWFRDAHGRSFCFYSHQKTRNIFWRLIYWMRRLSYLSLVKYIEQQLLNNESISPTTVHCILQPREEHCVLVSSQDELKCDLSIALIQDKEISPRKQMSNISFHSDHWLDNLTISPQSLLNTR